MVLFIRVILARTNTAPNNSIIRMMPLANEHIGDNNSFQPFSSIIYIFFGWKTITLPPRYTTY